MSNPTERETLALVIVEQYERWGGSPSATDLADVILAAGFHRGVMIELRRQGFDRWLAAHDAAVLRAAADRIRIEAGADECGLHDVQRESQLPEPSRVMLNGVTRSAERLRELASRPVVEGDNQ